MLRRRNGCHIRHRHWWFCNPYGACCGIIASSVKVSALWLVKEKQIAVEEASEVGDDKGINESASGEIVCTQACHNEKDISRA